MDTGSQPATSAERARVRCRITSSSGSAMEYYIVDKSSNPTTDLGEAVRYVVFKVRMSDIKCE